MRAILLALVLSSGVASAAHDSKATATAKAHVTSARAELKTAREHDKAIKTAKRAKAKAAREAAKRERAKLAAEDAALGCGPCLDDNHGGCVCPP